MSSWGVWWGLSLERPAWASLPPAVIREQERDGLLPVGTAAQLGAVIVSRRTKRSLRPELALSRGPLRLAQPGTGTYVELYGARWAVGLYRGGPRLYQAQAGVWLDRSDPASLAELPGARHIALAFDQAARPVVAWERDSLVYIRQWSQAAASYVTRGPWPGRDPNLICDATLHGEPSLSDVLLVHIDGEYVVGRHQRESYAVPHTLAVVPAGAVLDQIVPGGLAWQALGEAGRAPLVLRSGLYPAYLRGKSRSTVSGLSGGTYRPAVIVWEQVYRGAQGTVSGLSGGTYRPAVIVWEQVYRGAQGTVSGLSGGSFRPSVIQYAAIGRMSSAMTGLNGGSRVVVVVTKSVGPGVMNGTVTGLSGGTFNA